MYKLLSITLIYNNKKSWKKSDYKGMVEWLVILQLKMALMKNIENVHDIQVSEKAGYNTDYGQQ